MAKVRISDWERGSGSRHGDLMDLHEWPHGDWAHMYGPHESVSVAVSENMNMCTCQWWTSARQKDQDWAFCGFGSAVGFCAASVKAPVLVCVAGCVSVLCIVRVVCIHLLEFIFSIRLDLQRGVEHQTGMGKTSRSASTSGSFLLGQEEGTHRFLNSAAFSYSLTKRDNKSVREWMRCWSIG